MKDLSALKNKIEKMRDSVPAAMEEITKNVGADALGRVKMKTPWRTGELRRHWNAEYKGESAAGYSVELLNNTEYGPYVEYGHRIVRKGKTIGFVEGKHMVHNAIEEEKGSVQGIADAVLKKYLQ